MATVAQTLRGSPAPLIWVREFLREELAPYPGRVALVARMVLAATIVMVICMAFRIPYGFQGAIFALLITRESPRATLQSSAKILIGIAISTAYVLLSVYFVINFPGFHFIWIIFSFFVAFYAVGSMTDYATSTTFAVVISVAVPLWDRYVPAKTNVEDTLWVALSSLVGILVLLAVEVIAARRRPGDDIVLPVAERLTAVEGLLTHLAAQGAIDDASKKNIVRYAMLGSSRLRRLLRRSDYTEHYKLQMNAVAVAVGRLVDTMATLPEFSGPLSSSDRQKSRELAGTIATVRVDLLNRRIPSSVHFDGAEEASRRLPQLYEIEEIVSLIPQAFADSQSMGEYAPSFDDPRQPKLLCADAFTDARHVKFALKGCLAATASYIIYNAIDWPGISTAVTTCLLTALSTIGASRQKQALRFAGAIAGGFVLGMGSQVFVLPYLDSIFGLTVLFVIVTVAASWFMTCSPRLSYFGLQAALAFYLINLQEFAIVTSLAAARDRVVGVLLGLFMMWLVFDQLWSAPASVEMKKAFVRNLRLMAQVVREPFSSDPRVTKAPPFSLRETVGESFDSVRAMADAALLEFGPSREQDLRWRKRIQAAQVQLRTLFLTRMALWKYLARTRGFELPQEVLRAQEEFDKQSARILDGIADRVEGKTSTKGGNLQTSFEHLQQVIGKIGSQGPRDMLEPQLPAFLALSSRSEKLTIWLNENI
jgi:multidrug resistance protein MdtO